jgi:hypothetical protein
MVLTWQPPKKNMKAKPKNTIANRYIIEKGNTWLSLIIDWLKKMDCIKDVFHDMMEDDRADKTKTCC